MRCPLFVAAASIVALPALALAQPALYEFTINTAASGVNASASLSAQTSGTLIGNWDPDTNPTGTRTKPGTNIFAPFGPEENLPVPTDLGLNLGGPIDSGPAGSFLFSVNPATGAASISEFSANLLSTGPASLPLMLGIAYDGFRTRNPSSLFLAPPFPVEIPFGEATLASLLIEQSGPGAGLIAPGDAPGEYTFVVAPFVTVTATLSFLGNEFTVPGVPIPFLLTGTLTLNGDTAEILSIQPLDFGTTANPGLELPQFPLDLPTILPPGDTAHLLLNLMLDEIGVTLEGTQVLSASGVLVPAPGGLAAASALAFALLPRRRRR